LSTIASKITGVSTATSGGLTIRSTAGDITIDANTGASRTGSVDIRAAGNIDIKDTYTVTSGSTLTLYADNDININADLGTDNGYMYIYPDYDSNGTGSVNQAAGTTITQNYGSSTGIIYIYSSGASNYLANISADRLYLAKRGSNPTYTVRDNSTITLDYSSTTAYSLYVQANNTIETPVKQINKKETKPPRVLNARSGSKSH